MQLMRTHLPSEAIIAVNLECNARCSMCEIWKLREKGTLTPDDYRNLPSSLERIGITGGEPFMREDIADIIRTVHRAAHGPAIVVSTNGYLTKKILATIEALDDLRPRIGIGLSLDGVGKMHDRIRGTRHAFDKVMRTAAALQQRGVSNLRFSFTITNDNIDDLPATYDLARSLGIEFCTQLAHNSQLYYHTSRNAPVDRDKLRKVLAYVNGRELASTHPKRWFRAYFNSGITEHNETGKRLVGCDALDRLFYLSPHGDVHPCIFIPTSVGNIKDDAFDSIWLGDNRRTARDAVAACEKCWVICTARTGLRRKVPAALGWVAKHQSLRLVGRRAGA
jgi:MoaA/NifB/PqqE/SkfB family radical SAM enzyme